MPFDSTDVDPIESVLVRKLTVRSLVCPDSANLFGRELCVDKERLPLLGAHVGEIVLLRSNEKVRAIATSAIVASVKYAQFGRDRTDLIFVGGPMRFVRPAKHPIAIVIETT